MTAIFDVAAAGDVRARAPAQEVCRVCPVRPECLRQTVTEAPWPAAEGPVGVVAGLVIREPRRNRPVLAGVGR